MTYGGLLIDKKLLLLNSNSEPTLRSAETGWWQHMV